MMPQLLLLFTCCLACLLPTTTSAWGLQQHTGNFNRGVLTRLRLANGDEAEKIASFRAQLEEMYDDNDKDLLKNNQFSLDEDEFILPFESSSEDWFETTCRGEDCEQCEIPEDFKIVSDVRPVDVMSFLGIRRAEPLRVDRDWE